MLYGGFLFGVPPVARQVGNFRGVFRPAQPNSREKFIQNLLPTHESLLFLLDISPARGDDARWIGNFVGPETFDVSTTRSKKVPAPLYQLIYVEMRAHVALECVPLGNYALADND